MTLAEKFAYMATGKPYNDLDPLLVQARDQATLKANALNAEDDSGRKEELVRQLFGSAGQDPFVVIVNSSCWLVFVNSSAIPNAEGPDKG